MSLRLLHSAHLHMLYYLFSSRNYKKNKKKQECLRKRKIANTPIVSDRKKVRTYGGMTFHNNTVCKSLQRINEHLIAPLASNPNRLACYMDYRLIDRKEWMTWNAIAVKVWRYLEEIE
jgi:hypothetical protein